MAAKPQFDESQPYQVADDKPAFDPNQPYQAAGDDGGDNSASSPSSAINPEGTPFYAKPFRSIEAYTTSPLKAGIGSMEKGYGFLDAATSQMGKNPDLAPTTKSLIPDSISLPDTIGSLQTGVARALEGSHTPFGFLAGQYLRSHTPKDAEADAINQAALAPVYVIAGKAAGLLGGKLGLLPEAAETTAASPTAASGVSSESPIELENSPMGPQQQNFKPIPEPGPAQNKTPSTIEQIRDEIEKAKSGGANLDRPAASVIADGDQYVPDEKYPLLPVQRNALANQNTWTEYQVAKRDPTNPLSQILQDRETLQKQDWSSKLDDTLSTIAKRDPIDNPTEAGENAISTMLDSSKAIDKGLAPVFQAIKDLPVTPGEYSSGLVDKIKSAFPNFQFNEKEVGIPGLENDPDAGPMTQYSMGPYKQKTGMTPALYNQIKSTFDEVANEPYSPSDLQKIRQTLRNSIDPTSKTSAPLMRLNSVLLDHLQHVVGAENPNLAEKILPTFDAYRQNQQNISDLESVLGSSLSDRAGLMDKVPPEKALTKLFANSNTTQVAKRALGNNFNGVSSDFVNQIKNQAIDNNGNFSSAKFSTGLRRYQPALQEAFKDNPTALKRIQSLADRMRLVPDAPPANPSGTANAESLLNRAKELGSQALEFIDKPAATSLKMGARGVGGFLKKRNQASAINDLIKGE